MQVLIREVREGRDGIAEVRDAEFTGDELGIGSAADQPLQLLGLEPRHAVLRLRGGAPHLVALGGVDLLVNDGECRESALAPGDRVELGGHGLLVVRAPAGFDIAVELRRNAKVDGAEFEKAFRTDLSQTWLPKRGAAWLLAVLVVSIGFAAPLVIRALQPTVAAGKSQDMREMHRRHGWLPDDALWSSGPLAPAHALATGDSCAACHQKLFVRVQDERCKACHTATQDHVLEARLDELALPPQERCAVCHHEHDEPTSHLVRREDQLCTSCHADPHASLGAKVTLAAARDFSVADHPHFRVRLLRPPAAATIDWTFATEMLAKARETSNLKFSHAQHLDPDLPGNAGRTLGCASCHALSADGEHFQPVTMAGQCSSCHELTFDPDLPTRQLPHGKPQEVVATLQEYFVRKALDPTAPQPAPAREQRRLPGRQVQLEPREGRCASSTLACGQQNARSEIEQQFVKKGCVSCHVVEDLRAGDPRERYHVMPVRLNYDYMPAARFNHRQHLVQNALSGDAACLDCHRAKDSKDSAELMMPDIEKCVDCHGGSASSKRIRSPCMSCHTFHPLDTSGDQAMRRIGAGMLQ